MMNEKPYIRLLPTDKINEIHENSLLCNAVYGSSSIGPTTGEIYIRGKTGKVFNPYGERDSDAIMNWLADNHKDEFISAINAYGGVSDPQSIRTRIIKKALEVAHLLYRTDEYLGMQISYPPYDAEIYLPFHFVANQTNLQSFIKDPTSYAATIRSDFGGESRFLRRAINHSIRFAKERYVSLNTGGVFFGVVSCKFDKDATGRPVPIYHIHTFAYSSRTDNNIYDLGTECITVENGIKTKLEQLSKIGVVVNLEV